MTPFVSEINEDMLRQFEEELDGQRAKVEQARELIKHKKSLAIRKKAEEMRAAVADLDKIVVESRETRKTLRKQLLERKALMKTQVAAHQELQRTTWNVERAHHLEAVALKRLELERIHDEQRRMETLLDVATIELDAIEGEKQRRQESIDVQLKRILDKGTVLKQQLVEGHLNVPQVRQTIQDEGYDHFVEECHGLRRQQQQQRLLELHARQKQLNTDRAKLLADEDVLRQQIHQHVSTDTVQDDLRGREPILPSSMPFPECDDCVDDVLAQASQFLAAGDATLSALQESIVNKCNVAHTNAACFPAAYDGSLGRESYPPSLLAARDMAQSIVWDVVNDLPPSMFETIRSLKQQRELVLMDLAASTVVRQRLDPPQPVRISSIQTFGTHVLVSASSQLQLWTTRPVKDRALSIVFHLTKDDLQSVGHKLQDVTTGCFVPAASLAGTPTSILVGTADGSICRLNRSTDDCRAVFGADLVPRPCLANTMSPMILPPNPRQTLYQFHRAAIIFLATVGHPLSPSFLSVDATGVVCRWDNDNWTGFGWFEPAQSVQLVGSGVVQSCLLAPDTSRLVVFTFEGSKRQGAFVQVAWEPSLSVLPVVIRIGCEAPPPPFTLLPSPAALSRTSCDCVLVMGSSLALYSLATDRRMVRAVVVATIEEILSQFLPHPTSSTMLSSPTLA
ncbi:hypothetical protein DYB32_007855 [Aphanomyces invadans]|uniref:Uncharacterized protein n=1 Tax=Aphanomyces invadans TaxID=157072 RepID=A0A418AMX9_9STRA|nr:hypothetical protein DYB32_007855 [Aphanomyces invadans]